MGPLVVFFFTWDFRSCSYLSLDRLVLYDFLVDSCSILWTRDWFRRSLMLTWSFDWFCERAAIDSAFDDLLRVEPEWIWPGDWSPEVSKFSVMWRAGFVKPVLKLRESLTVSLWNWFILRRPCCLRVPWARNPLLFNFLFIAFCIEFMACGTFFSFLS